MQRVICLLALFLSIHLLKAQVNEVFPDPKYPELFKTLGCPILPDDPEWVWKMYSNNPNFFEITRAYQEYYQSHKLVKTTHTQNYKHFYRLVSTFHYYDKEGYIQITHEKASVRFDAAGAGNSQGKKGNLWTPVAPIETFEPDGERTSSHVNIYSMAQSKSNPNVLYVGTETGAVFKSIDKAENWLEVGENDFDYENSQSIKIDPNNENVVYIAHDSRLFKTIDGGRSWIVLLSGTLTQFDVEVSPANSDLVYLCGRFGLKRSTDAGQTWNTIFTDPITDIEFKSDDPSTVFIAKQNTTVNRYEIWKSVDNGLTFTPRTAGWFTPTNAKAQYAEGAKIANTAADPNRLYVLLLGTDIDYSTDLNYLGIYRSDDVGETWSLPYDGDKNGVPDNEPGGPYTCEHWAMSTFHYCGGDYDQGFYNAAIDVSDTDPNTFLVGMLNLFKSTDGGVSFKTHGGYLCDGCNERYRHPDIQGIFVQNSDVWVATDGGMDKYDSDFELVDSKNKGITTCDLWGFDQGWNEDVLVGGRYHNGNMAYHENYGAGNTLALGGAESATGFVNLGENRKVYFDDIGGVQISPDLTGVVTNVSAPSIFPTSGNSMDKSEMVNDPRWWNHLLMGKDNKLWKSVDYGASYTLVKAFGGSGFSVKGIEVSRKNPDVIFVNVFEPWQGSYLWRSTDGGASWTEITLPDQARLAAISLNEENDLFIVYDFAVDFAIVYTSPDLGQTWTDLSTPAIADYAFMDVEVQEGTNGGVYLVARKAVFYRNKTMADWINISDGLPASFSLLDAKPFYKSGKLRLAGNRGVWERDFYEPSAPKAQPMVASREFLCDRQVLRFEDYSILDHTNATWEWNFPGASSVSSTTARNPTVTYSFNNPGMYSVTLTVKNNHGTSTKTVRDMVVVGKSNCKPGPYAGAAAKFEGGPSQYLSTTLPQTKTVTHFTFSAWIKPDGIQPDFTSIIYTYGISLDFKNGINELGTHCGSLWDLNSGLIVPQNQWSYVALIYTPTKVTLVLNEKTYQIFHNFSPHDINAFDLGINDKRWDRVYKGLLDEVCLWDRELTLEELRLNRHLTKAGDTDSSLFAYYQFNNPAPDIVYDVKNDFDLSRNGVPVVSSTCPVGPGISRKLTITKNNTTYNFDSCDVKLTTESSSFNGDVYVTRIKNLPSGRPLTYQEANPEYYILDNYGSINDIGILGSLEFSDIQNLDGLKNDGVKLFQRERNGDSLTQWIDKGSPSQLNGRTINFSSVNITSPIPFVDSSGTATLNQSSGQFYITTTNYLSVKAGKTADDHIYIYPNPSRSVSGFRFVNIGNDAFLKIFDSRGKLISTRKINENENITDINTAGVYFYQIETVTKIVCGKIIVNE